MTMTATYSPEDNKLRLKPTERLDEATYRRVKDAGFSWAPKQQIFVAGMWTPEREDLLLELAGGIGDEDTTLMERAAERAERFDEYSEKRGAEAEQAHRYVESIAGRIEPGQPIIVGHHSQRRAERDKEKMERGMARAVNLFRTSQYWESRAEGALAHARYKEEPDVRHRRIKGLQSDERKFVKQLDEIRAVIRMWDRVPRIEWDKQDAFATFIASRVPYQYQVKVLVASGERVDVYTALKDRGMKGDTAWRRVIPLLERALERPARWLEHTRNRIAYEKAMLNETGGITASKFDLKPGGRVKVQGEWVTIVRLNKKGGEVVSVSTNARFVPVRGIEEIEDYEAPTVEAAEQVKAVTTLYPLCNYDHETFLKMTKAEYAAIYSDYKATRTIGQGAKGDKYNRIDITPFEAYGPHRIRVCLKFEGAGRAKMHGVYLTDQKTTLPPTPAEVPPAPGPLPAPERAAEDRRPVYQPPAPNKFDHMADVLRTGIQAVAAPQLFPTPADLAERMVDEAHIVDGERVLEPSAGTGNILRALRATGKSMHIVAVEINHGLVQGLRTLADMPTDVPQAIEVVSGDFLQPLAIGKFTRILMNPPFVNGEDIKHILHAYENHLQPGGLLVAICAGGPRQEAKLKQLAEDSGGIWEPLPAGTFAVSGTNVNTVLLSIYKED